MTASAPSEILIEIAFSGYWCSGTGQGRGRRFDGICHRDRDGFPAMPMSQVRGTLREGAERLAETESAGWTKGRVKCLFGDRREPDDREEATPGLLDFLGEARLVREPNSNADECFRPLPQTRIGPEGAAQDRTLRTSEVAMPGTLRGLVVCRDPDACPDWATLLAAAGAATTAYGRMKPDGLGTAVTRLYEVAEPSGIAGGPMNDVAQGAETEGASGADPSKHRRFTIRLTQREAAIFSRRSATEGAHATNPAPTGAALLGWVASRAGYTGFSDPFTVFHSGKVRFGDAVPLGSGGVLSMPLPKILMEPKHERSGTTKDDEGRRLLVQGAVRRGRPAQDPEGGQSQGDTKHVQHEAVKYDYVTEAGEIVEPALGQRLRTAIKNGRAAESQLFGLQHVRPDDTPIYEAVVEAEPDAVCDADWSRIRAAFDGATLRLGRAKASGYGGHYKSELVDDRAPSEPPDLSCEKVVRILALADLALACMGDEDDPWSFGAPTAHPTAAMFGLPGTFEFKGADSAVSVRRYRPWNAHLGARDTDRQVIEAGSVLTFYRDDPGPVNMGDLKPVVGLWRESGLGRVAFNPPMLSEELPKFEGQDELGDKPAKSGPGELPAQAAQIAPPKPREADGLRLVVLRVTLEAVSPLSIGSGETVSTKRAQPADADGNTERDVDAAALARDALGLPVIPAPGYQGVLRQLYRRICCSDGTDAVFGYVKGSKGAASVLICGWGTVHDAEDRSQCAGRDMSKLKDDDADPVLKFLAGERPLWRDHAAHSHRGAVEGRKKFARTAVPPGTRFSLPIAIWARTGDGERPRHTVDEAEALLRTIARLFGSPRFRLGGATRRGYGRVKVVRASIGQVNPMEAATTMADAASGAFGPDVAADTMPLDLTIATVTFRPRDLFRIGAGTEDSPALTPGTHGARRFDGTPWRMDDPFSADDPYSGTDDQRNRDRDHDAILRILREPSIRCANGVGSVERPRCDSHFATDLPAPGSALRGPLVHRTLFHWNRAHGGLLDADDPNCGWDTIRKLAERPDALAAFLGTAKEKGRNGEGRASDLTVEDGEVTNAEWAVAIDHNSIDRFTGGVRDGMLYREEALVGASEQADAAGRMAVTFRLLIEPKKGGGMWDDSVVRAFLSALRDLAAGELAIGAKSLGYGTAEVVWEGLHKEHWQAAWNEIGGQS